MFWNVYFFQVFVILLFSSTSSHELSCLSFIILCVCVLFPSQTLIFSLGSAVSILVTKLMKAITITIKISFLYRKYLTFLLVLHHLMCLCLVSFSTFDLFPWFCNQHPCDQTYDSNSNNHRTFLIYRKYLMFLLHNFHFHPLFLNLYWNTLS